MVWSYPVRVEVEVLHCYGKKIYWWRSKVTLTTISLQLSLIQPPVLNGKLLDSMERVMEFT